MISDVDVVVRDASALFTEVDGELILLDVNNGKYLTIDAIGMAIWRSVARPIRLDALVEKLAGEFAGPRDQIARDVTAFLTHLMERGLFQKVAP